MARHTRLTPIAACMLLSATSIVAQHVLLPFSQHHDLPGLSPRASEQATLKSSEYAYLVDASVGTPAQNLSLVISPSSGHTWVPDANTFECSPEWYYGRYSSSSFKIPASECKWGSYNSSLSSTYLPANRRYTEFDIYNPAGGYIYGTNVTDKLVVGSLEIDDYPMGVVQSGSQWIGTLGLGYNASVSSSSTSSTTTGKYANVMDRMVSSGKIASSAYSIWLDNPEGTSGGLLFGAVDKSRYTGDLVRFYAYSSYSYYNAFGTTLNAINGTSDSGSAMPPIKSNDFPIDISLGPAEVFSYLPDLLADKIAAMAGATYNQTARIFTIPCDAAKTNNARFVLELAGSGGPKLNVETADLVVSPKVLEAAQSARMGNACLFGVQKYALSSSSSSSSSSYGYNLGSSLLRRSYMVFDLANHEIAIASAVFPGKDAPKPDVAAFASYGAVIPSAICVSNVYCRFSGTGSGSGSGSGYGSGNGNGYNSTSAGLEDWQKIAVGVGVPFGVLLLIAMISVVIVCNRLRKAKAGKDVVDEESQDGDASAMAQTPVAHNGARGSMVLPGALPMIREGTEPNAQEPPPALGTVTPPEPTASANSNRASVAVSALSDEPAETEGQVQAQAHLPAPAAEPEGSPKGKGKGAVDHSET